MEKNKMMKNRKKVDFRELFSNNRFVLLFSIVLAFVIWTAISMTASPEETISGNRPGGYQKSYFLTAL